MKLQDVLGMKGDKAIENKEIKTIEKPVNAPEKTDVNITPRKVAKSTFKRYQKEVIEFSEKQGLRMREMCVLEHLLRYADGPSTEKKELLREAVHFLFEES